MRYSVLFGRYSLCRAIRHPRLHLPLQLHSKLRLQLGLLQEGERGGGIREDKDEKITLA